LENIPSYYVKDSPIFASVSTKKIFTFVEISSQFPNMDRIVPEQEDESLREIITRNYWLINKIRELSNQNLSYILKTPNIRSHL